MPRLKTYRITQNTRETYGSITMLRHGVEHYASRCTTTTDAAAVEWALDHIRNCSRPVDVKTDVWQLEELFKTKPPRPVAQWDGDMLALLRRPAAVVS